MINSYIPLYRKYRPQKFADVVGQESVVKTLSNAITLGKVAHAYLFTGPRGTGKTSLARILAKSLNCIEGPTLDPCGKCQNCIDIKAGNFVDVIEIDAASNRKVEDARNLLEKVQFVPISGKYKIYIIDEVHMLTTEAFNTLLKTLEEPPQNLIFILATTEAHKVLNTIISRCQRFDFRRIQQDLITERLQKISELENLNINNKALSLISRKSGGGLRDALSLLDQASVLATVQQELGEKDIATLLGSLQEDVLFEIVNNIVSKNAGNLITLLDKIIQSGNEPIQIIRELINYFRNLLLAKTTNNIEEIISIINVSEQFYEQLKYQSEKFEPLEITQIIDKLASYEKILRTTSQQQLWIEIALISICHRYDIQVVKDLELRIEKLEEALVTHNFSEIKISAPPARQIPVTKPEIKPDIKPEVKEIKAVEIKDIKQEPVKTEIKKPEEAVIPVVSNIASSSGNLDQDWKNLLDNINYPPTKGVFASLAKPVEINSQRVVIVFKSEANVKQAQEKSKLEHIEKALKNIFGTVPKIIIRTSLPEDDKITNTMPKQEKFEQIYQEIEEIPAKNTLKIDIVEQSIEPMDEEVSTAINEIDKNISIQENMPDQAKFVLQLFPGSKILE